MKRLLHLVKQFLAKYPGLRRKVVNAIYRIPMLDMRLRAALDQRNDQTWRRVDAADLPEEVRTVYTRLRDRMERR
ncbi:hypothetical protein [Dyella caseinilytica]|uniref:Uncharacterized protein n=1 Tax=Dyella caseinilytica TaxID=1849581 RepID=A0ABX7GSR8_9GAMM|nr:hypothetical protein [Dyella caseinilytica]QRN53071.1 hypothetical protein ISN74_16755 [Dyella caseinilytica]GGA11216.1 hypothetical protein GCM10011408_35710 [Dyella caseinilytica]